MLTMRKRIAVAVAVLAVAGGIVTGGPASAAVPLAPPAPAPAAPAPAPAPPAASNYTPLTPSRLLDTRTSKPIPANGRIVLRITGRNGVPTRGVTAVTFNLTATRPTTSGFLVAYPDGAPRPLASSINFVKNQTVANEITVAVGRDGSVDIYNHSGTTDAVVDLAGYFSLDAHPTAASTGTTGAPAPTKPSGGTTRTGGAKPDAR